ncbi:MAG: 30S ribosomal protein S12 methylthiotransferase RimO [Defluviitaleaceae bacterium]|nr:30S ribosomal protein S12 methylthiotransferase RimO [Defluviitaleaceae bacterium]
MTIKVYLFSLGCDKNKVDGEVMLGQLLANEYFISVSGPAEADAIIVNTCGFIREATEESIDCVLDMAAYKKSGNCRALIVVGCMTERYREDFTVEIPEVDAVLGVADRDKIVKVLGRLFKRKLPKNKSQYLQHRLLARKDISFPHIAYVKIAEGCDNRCAYCTIPSIRGGYKSRQITEIIKECEALVNDGAREIVLVAQDTARYGMDRYGEPRLAELLRKLNARLHASCGQAVWVRLLYAYPQHITPDLIRAIAELEIVCKYLDIPIQHSEDTTLARMGRGGSREALRDLIRRLREQIPDITLRTTVMVGFPGETNEEFRGLYSFVKEARFERLGVFPYSREEGTPAATMPLQVKDEIKHIRRDRIMALQQRIHMIKQRHKTGKPLDVMVDECTLRKDGEYQCIGRSQSDAPEVDAVIHFSSERQLLPGQVVTVLATSANDYDLQGVHTHEPAE